MHFKGCDYSMEFGVTPRGAVGAVGFSFGVVGKVGF